MSARRTWCNVARAGLGALVSIAIGSQLAVSAGNAHFHVANFFSYFTILSNVFEALVLFVAASSSRPSHALDVVRGASTLSLVLVGLVFSLLLRDVESDLMAWVNFVLHYLMPVAALADWSLDPPARTLAARDALLWLLVPLGYVAYALIRGAIVHWYPYPFLNVDAAGPAAVAAYVASLTVATCLLAALVLSLGNLRRTRRTRPLG